MWTQSLSSDKLEYEKENNDFIVKKNWQGVPLTLREVAHHHDNSCCYYVPT